MTTGGEILSRLEAVVLAAGLGSRFGGGKLTTPWRAGVLLDGALATAFASPVRAVTVVTGADPDVERVARDFTVRNGVSVPLRFVHAADHAAGMSASLRAGIASLPPDSDAAFVFLGDMPRVPVAVLTPLANAVAGGAFAAAPTFEGRRGHPVLFARPLFAQLLAIEGDEGARSVLSRLGEKFALIPTSDPGVLLDIDRPSDLQGA